VKTMWRYSLQALVCSVWLLLPSDTLQEPIFTGPKVVAVSSLEQIRLGGWHLPPSITTLRAAKNETESFQLVVRAPQSGLSNVRVRVSPFRNEAGDTLPPPTLYREHYVYAHSVKREYYKRETFVATNLPQPSGWYADALIPFEVDDDNARFRAQPFEVARFQNQPVWVDAEVPSGARAGSYQSTYTVSSSEGEVSGTITLEVWDFTLPERISLDSSFLVWRENTKEMYAELLSHRLMPDHVENDFQKELMETQNLRLQRLGFNGNASYKDCTMDEPPPVEDVQELASEQAEGLELYIYPADEITGCTTLNDTMKAWSRNVHEAKVKNLVTMFPRQELFDDGSGKSAVDIWVIYATQLMNPSLTGIPGVSGSNLDSSTSLSSQTALATVQQALDKGDAVWSYTALAAEPHAPQWALNYSAFDFRLLAGFINLRYDMTGLLYWRVDNWSDDPWRVLQVLDDPSNYPAGEGMLVYPGADVGVQGVVPSIRLKWLRDGAEDYEYGQFLKEQGQQELVSSIVQSSVEDWYHWTKDVKTLESTRETLAEAILSGLK
jgi:hypothetical protein